MDSPGTAMLTSMANSERPRMIFDCSEQVRRAVRIRAAKTGKTPSDIINEALAVHLPREMQEAAESLESGDESPPAKRGRPSKGGKS